MPATTIDEETAGRLRHFHGGPGRLRSRWWALDTPSGADGFGGSGIEEWYRTVWYRLPLPDDPATWPAAAGHHPPIAALTEPIEVIADRMGRLHADDGCLLLRGLGVNDDGPRTITPLGDTGTAAELLSAGCPLFGCGARCSALLDAARSWRAAAECIELCGRDRRGTSGGEPGAAFGDAVAVEGVLAELGAEVSDEPVVVSARNALAAVLDSLGSPPPRPGPLWWVSWSVVTPHLPATFTLLATHPHRRDPLLGEALCVTDLEPAGGVPLGASDLPCDGEAELFFELRRAGWGPADAHAAVRAALR